MTILKTADYPRMLSAGQVVAKTLQAMQAAVKPGISLLELDKIGGEVLKSQGAVSAPQLVYDFPGYTCISVNDHTVHGVPNSRLVAPGDVLTLDVTAQLNGLIADAAITVLVPPVDPLADALVQTARNALGEALRVATAGTPVFRLSKVIQDFVQQAGFAVIPQLGGHGLGQTIHEPPTIPNYYNRRYNDRLETGMVVAIEPIITAGKPDVVKLTDGWTIATSDGAISAHAEHTIIITTGDPIIVTRPNLRFKNQKPTSS